MPVTGPALVHDLGLGLRSEVIGLVADDGQDVALPSFEGSVLDQEKQEVLLWMLGESFGRLFLQSLALFLLGLEEVARVDVRVHVPLALEAGQLNFLLLILGLVEVVARN